MAKFSGVIEMAYERFI